MIQDSSWRPLPDFLTISKSTIEGLGLITTKDLPIGTDLGMTHIYDKRFQDGYIRLPLGAFINHAKQSNCVRTQVNNKWYLKTTKDIMPNDELTLTYSLYNPE